jgi:hypothetical protein
VVIDLTALRGVQVDAERRVAGAGPGATAPPEPFVPPK